MTEAIVWLVGGLLISSSLASYYIAKVKTDNEWNERLNEVLRAVEEYAETKGVKP